LSKRESDEAAAGEGNPNPDDRYAVRRSFDGAFRPWAHSL